MRKSNISVHDILFRTAGVLFILTLLSVYMLCGMYARYTTSDSYTDSARVASFGTIVLMEHEAVLADPTESGTLYKLTDKEVEQNTNIIALPGVNIPKDPFIRLENIGEVKCELYLKVTKSPEFPNGITYAIDSENWDLESDDGESSVYRYIPTIEPGSNDIVIDILKDNQLTVSPDYDSNDEFTLTFSAWLKQAKE